MAVVATLTKGYDLEYIWKQVDRGAVKDAASRWRGVVSLGYAAGGERIHKKVSGQTRTEVKDKLKALHSELDAGVRTVQSYTVEAAVADWLAEGLPGGTSRRWSIPRAAGRGVRRRR